MIKKQFKTKEEKSTRGLYPMNRLKKAVFDINCHILKSNLLSSRLEIVSLLVQMLQFLSFAFNHQHLSIWTNKALSNILIQLLNYSLLVPLIKDNSTMFFILFYISFAIICFNCISLSIVILLLSKENNANANANANTKKFSFISLIFPSSFAVATVFCFPFLELFASIFAIEPKTSSFKYLSSLRSQGGIALIHSVIGGLALALLLIYSVTLRVILFEVRPDANQINSKSTSKCDVVSIIIKAFVVLSFNLSYHYSSNKDQWITAILLLLFASTLLYVNYFLHPYYDQQMTKLNFGCFLIFFWSTLVGVAGKILNLVGFDGNSELFLLCCPLIIAALFFSDFSALKNSSLSQINSEHQFILEVYEVISLIEERFVNRERFLKLNAYLILEESDCITPNCSLKHYLERRSFSPSTLNSEISDDFVTSLLYRYIDSLFLRAIATLPYNSMLHLNYSFFLMSKLGKFDKAYKQLIQAAIYSLSLEDEFNVYRTMHCIEENECNTMQTSVANKSTANSISYFFHSAIFTQLINETTNLYIDFWSLMIKHSRGDNSFTQLNQIGSEINFLLKIIQKKQKELQQLKPNDANTLSLYSNFLKQVLRDMDQSEHIDILLKETAGNYREMANEIIETIDISVLSSTASIKFIVASTEEESFGKIVHLSAEAAGLFGYTSTELVNKSIEVLLPDLLKKPHTSFLRNQLSSINLITNSLTIQTLNKAAEAQIESQPKSKLREITVFGKIKSHYLIPLNLVAGIIPNERNESVLFAKINQFNYNSDKACFIMTDANFFIHYYTANIFKILPIQSELLNERTDITNNIREFYEEFFTKITNQHQHHSHQDTLAVKADIIDTRFAKPSLITWKEVIEHNQAKAKDDCRTIRMNKSLLDGVNLSNSVLTKPRRMTVTKLTLGSVLRGYIFKLEIPAEVIQVPSTWFTSAKSKSSNKIASRASVNNASEIGDKIDFDGNYLPEKHKITFDPIKMCYSFSLNDNGGNENKLAEYMKNKVLSKIEIGKMKTEVNHSDQESSSYFGSQSLLTDEDRDNEDEEEDDDDDDGGGDEEKTNQQVTQHPSFGRNPSQLTQKPTSSKTKIDDEYYKVNVAKIKLSIFNYKKAMPIEVKEEFSQDQVQVVIDKETKGKKSSSSIEVINPAELQPNTQNSIRAKGGSQKNIMSQVISEKASEISSKRKQKDFAVILLEIFLLSAFIAISIIGIVSFNEMQAIIKQMNTFTVLIRKVLDLFSYCVTINFFAVEYLLINNEKYTNYYMETSVYKNYTRNYLLDSFNTTLDLINSIYGTYISISPEAKTELSEVSCLIKIIDAQFLHNLFNVTLYAALIESNSAQYNLATATELKQNFLNFDLHYLFFNMDNATTRGLNETFHIYFKEQAKQITQYKFELLMILGGFIALLILVVLSGRYCVNSVLKLKEKYFEVFCRLSEATIKKALDKCLLFSQSYSSNHPDDKDSFASHPIELKGDSNFMDEKSNSKISDRKEDKTFQGDKNEVKRIIQVFWVFDLILLVVLGLLVAFTWNYFERSHDALLIYYLFIQNEYNLVKMFQYLKAYIVLGTFEDSYSFDYYGTELKTGLAAIYFGKTMDHQLRYSLINDKRLNDAHNTIIKNIYFDNLCYLFDKALENELKNRSFDCESFANNSTAKGFEVVLNQYTDSIQAMESIADKKVFDALQTFYYFNEIFYGTPLYFIVPPWNPDELEEYNRLNPFFLFNDEYMKELTLQTIFVVIPEFSVIKTNIIMSYRTERDRYKFTLTASIAIYFGILVGFYAIYFIPKEKRIKREVRCFIFY